MEFIIQGYNGVAILIFNLPTQGNDNDNFGMFFVCDVVVRLMGRGLVKHVIVRKYIAWFRYHKR